MQSFQYEYFEFFLLKLQKALSTGKKIILVITYLCYLRQCKEFKEKLGEMIVKSLLNYENIIKIIVIDPHVKLNIKSEKYEEISCYDLFFDEIKEKVSILKDCCILSPDKSSGKKNDIFAKKLKIDNIIADKMRDTYGEIISCGIKNYKYHSSVIVIDDIIDTGNTILEAINSYLEVFQIHNNKDIDPIFFIYCTHGVLTSINKKLINIKNVMDINISLSYVNYIMRNKWNNMKCKDDFFNICIEKNLYKKIKIFEITNKIYKSVQKAIDNM